MLKKLNILIVSFFLVLSVKSDLLFAIVLPVFIFYIFHSYKNMYYIYIPSIISILLFAKEYIIIHLILIIISIVFLSLFSFLVNKDSIIVKKTNLLICIYLVITNTILFFVYPKSEISIIFKLLYIILSILIYLLLDIYLYKLLSDAKNIRQKLITNFIKAQDGYIYIEYLIAFLTIIAASYLNIKGLNLSILVGSYFVMYFSRRTSDLNSLLFGLLVLVYEYAFLQIEESFIIIMIASIYLVKSIYTIGVFNVILVLYIVFSNTTKPYLYISLMFLSIIFEFISHFLLKITLLRKDDYEQIHMAIQKNVNEEILKFASFLDRFVIGFQNPKGFNEKLSSGIKTIIDKHCKNCPNQKLCFNQNKNKLYPIFKDILVLNKDAIYNTSDFSKECFKYPSILNTSKVLNEKINFSENIKSDTESNNYILLSQISGVSNALKNYVVDTTTKEELDYNLLLKAEEYLKDLELFITYYEIIRSYKNDFLIKIGFKNCTIEQISPILNNLYETICESKISVELIETENTTTYVHVMPRLIIDINYAYGNIPAVSEVISGDNYLIKEKNNGHMLFAISDGMGKGYSAFYESDMTLRLVDDIVNLNVESSTALEILNTFYTVQDYLERYATLDFLDINRHSGIATFYKMGANNTYIFKKNGEIKKIINKSLPLGIDELVDEVTYTLENDDLIIMSSDGVLENLIDNKELEKFIIDSKDLLPQQLVYEILNYTTTHKVKVKDDMTLIILKITKK